MIPIAEQIKIGEYVFAVGFGAYGDYEIEAVFPTPKMAEAYIAAQPKGRGVEMGVHAFLWCPPVSEERPDGK